jgi:DNA-binding PadR family transcriptional regulator
MIADRILQVLDQNGGVYFGTEQMALDAPASKPGLLSALSKCVKHNLVRVRRGGGAGRRTCYRLTQKGLDHVRSK